MTTSTERRIIRWIHIIASIPIIGYIYGHVKNLPHAVAAIQWVLFPPYRIIRALVMEGTLGEEMGTKKK